MALFDIAANLRAPAQLQLDDCIHPSSWGSLESYLSRRMPVRWHAVELTVKWRSTDRLLSPMRTYCVLGYLLLERHWSATLTRTAQTITFDPGPGRRRGLEGKGRVEVNKPTTNIYFPFFSVSYHLSLHGKISGLGEIRAWKFGVLIFGPRIFLVSSGIRQVCEGKTAW